MLLDSVPFTHMHIHGHSLAPRAHKNAKLQENYVIAVLSQASANTRASAHHPILTVLWFFEVLRVTANHAKFRRKVC